MPEPVEDEVKGKTIIPTQERKKRGKRSKLPENLPRKVVIIDIESKFSRLTVLNLNSLAAKNQKNLKLFQQK